MKKQDYFVKQIVLRKLRQHWPEVCLLILVLTVSGMVSGFLQTEALRRITQAIWDGAYGNLVKSMLFLIFIIICNGVCLALSRMARFCVTKGISFACEDEVCRSYARQDYWAEEEAGQVLGKVRKVLPETMSNIVLRLTESYQTSIMILSACLYGIFLNPYILGISAAVTGVMIFLSRRSLGNLSGLYQKFTKQNAKLHERLWEQIKNREVAIFLNQNRVAEAYEKESKDYLSVLQQIKKSSNGAGLFSVFGSVIMIVLVAFLGGRLVLEGKMGEGGLLALILLIPSISAQLFQIPQKVTEWKEVLGSCVSINQMLRAKTYKNRAEHLCEKAIETIEIQGLCFSYTKEEKEILKGISFKLSSGFYALAGDSGCGKSTLLKLLARLLPYEEGEILMNNQSLKSIQRNSYWEQIGISDQTPVILNETLLYNITMSEDKYDERRLEEALKDAGLIEFTAQSALGINRVICADTLSKGEKLRISIARMYYRRAKILFLDEITEALDPNAEVHILKALKKRVQAEKMIVLCISHRVEPLQMSDQVIFMKDGRIDEIAAHKNILESNEGYRRLLKEVPYEKYC